MGKMMGLTMVNDGEWWLMVNSGLSGGLYFYILVGGAITILGNDGVRQWEGWHPIYYGK